MAQPQQRPIANRPISFLNRNGLFLILLALLVFLGVYLPLSESPLFMFQNRTSSSSSPSFVVSDWRDYSLAQAAKFVAKNGTVIVCAVSYPFLPFLNNWLISISRQKHHEKVLVIAEDYALLYKVNEKWPGHAVLIPPALDPKAAHHFGSQKTQNRAWRSNEELEDLVNDSRSHSKSKRVTLKQNHKFLIKIEIVVSLTLVSSVNLSLVSVIKTLDFDPNHVDAGVSAIASHLTRSMAVSTSFGGVFKIWFCNSEKSQTVKDSSWMCHAVGSY
ncbi:hypothetical protein DY000_02031249 [Brassica cretica]|uniref:Nucleotide-diphospho-sugar transferase domain-containing protein n=1 Tax=Brassica cretica TaxID=69181 RepID=A0ABQ7DM36_BRACR|nr:hypothetical protein DY000_02031249 [Brassica cretica]